MSVTTARQKVLGYLKKNRFSTTREIARGLKMSAPNVRHHLSVLCSDGRVERVGGRTGERRGRPEKVYSLPRAALGDNLSALSDALLVEAGSKVKMEALGKHLVGESNFASQPVAKKLSLVVEKLNAMNYHAHWEAGAEGPRMIFGHCPYASIIERHPELCNMDGVLLKEMLGMNTEQKVKLEGLLPVCVFLLKG